MYFITAINSYNIYKNSINRTVGYFKNYDKAKLAIYNNADHLNEYLYDYLVLEEIAEGIHGRAIREEWFEWYGKDGWVGCNQPKWAEGVTNWAVG